MSRLNLFRTKLKSAVKSSYADTLTTLSFINTLSSQAKMFLNKCQSLSN